MNNPLHSDTRRRLKLTAAVYFGSFVVWSIIDFIFGGFQWRALVDPFL